MDLLEDDAYAIETRLLRLGCERRKNEANKEHDREPDPPHEHRGEGWLAGSLAERRDVHQRGGTSRGPS